MTRLFRATDMMLFAAMVAAAAFTYKTKHEAEAELASVRKLEQQIRYEEDSIDLLKADWSLLTQPSRLQKLAELYQADLNLQPTEAHQYAGLDDLPPPPLTIEELASQPLGDAADSDGAGQDGAGQDKTVTGAVTQ